LLALLLIAPAALAEEVTKGWKDVAEFSLVATDGNSESTSLGFKNTLTGEFDKSTVTFRVGGINVESTGPRFAVDDVVMDGPTETTAEHYFAKGRYDREITEHLFWFAGAGWDRNEPAGIKNRYILESGVGNTWFKSDDRHFKTTYGATFTDQEDVVTDPTVDETFLGARLAWDYMNKLAENTTYTNVFAFDVNLDESSDWRADMANGLAVSMSERLALKVGLQWLYDNEPALELVPNKDGAGNALPPVPYVLDELDTILTVSLVVDFK
jgi:putative salt-induced outer membrane protein YdiY